MAPPMERDDREPGRQRGRDRYKDRERQTGDREAQTGTGTVSEEGPSKHSILGHRHRAGDDGSHGEVGPERVRQGGEKKREGGRCRAVLSLRKVRRDKRRAQAAATGPV